MNKVVVCTENRFFLFGIILSGIILSGIVLFRIRGYAEQGWNEYQGTIYDTQEDVEELERILQGDGYVCITRGMSYNEDWTEALSGNVQFANWITVNNSDYRVYVLPEYVSLFIEDKSPENAYELNEHTVVCDYYIFSNHAEGEIIGKIGSEIPDGTPVGTLSISGNMDENLVKMIAGMSSLEAPVATVILYGENTGVYYRFDLNVLNGYSSMQNVPADIYTIYSAYILSDYPAVWNPEYDRGITVPVNAGVGIEISFVPVADNSDGELSDTVRYNDINLQVQDAEEAPEKVQILESEKQSLALYIIVLLIVVSWAAILLKHMKKARSIDDE